VEEVVWTTLRLAGLTTVLLLVLATPLAWWLARSPVLVEGGGGRGHDASDHLAAVGAGLLHPDRHRAAEPADDAAARLRIRTLAFTFEGLVIGSMIYSLPFAVQPIRNAFEAMGERPMEVAATLRAAPFDAFVTVALPLARRGFLAAAILVFAHTIGEFGWS